MKQQATRPTRIAPARYAVAHTSRIFAHELFSKIEETAKALKAMGVKENEIITISMPNTPEAVYLFYAVSKIGTIANMVDPRTSSEGICKYIDEVKSDKVIIVDSSYNKVKHLTENGSVKQVVAVSPAESLPKALNLGYKAKEFIDTLKDTSKKNVYNEHTMNWKQFIEKGKNYIGVTEVEYEPNRPLVIEEERSTSSSKFSSKDFRVLSTRSFINSSNSF